MSNLEIQGYPGITPFEGMASGVVALVRNLPAGSPPIFYCITSLIQKATSLCNAVDDLDVDLWKNWEGELEPPKKVLDLLLRLLSLIDIQVRCFYYDIFGAELKQYLSLFIYLIDCFGFWLSIQFNLVTTCRFYRI